MDNNPLVSIITPCYNSSKYIERYLKSILNQKYSNIQQIIVNDGSTDNTEEIVFKYRDSFQKQGIILTYIRQENMGLGAAVNSGLKAVDGVFFTWCDSDNFFTQDYISEKVRFLLDHPNYSVVRCNGIIVNDEEINTVLGTLDEGTFANRTNEHLFYNCLFAKDFHFGCAMFKTEDFDKVVKDRNIFPSRYGQNWQLLLPMLYYYKTGYIDKAMFVFVNRSDSLSNSVYHMNYTDIITQNNAHAEIICKTLESMKISEQKELSNAIVLKYTQMNFILCFVNKDKKLMKQEYRKLKKLKKVTQNDRLGYLETCQPLVYKLLTHIGYGKQNGKGQATA